MGNEPEKKAQKPQNRNNHHRIGSRNGKSDGRNKKEHAEKTFLHFGQVAWLCQRVYEEQQGQQAWYNTAVQIYTDIQNGYFGWSILTHRENDWVQVAVITRSIITGKICWVEGQGELTQKRLVSLDLLQKLLPLLKEELHTLMSEKAEA